MSTSIPQVNPETLPPGTVVGGSWRLLERLGAGGYGAVYKVEAIQDPGRYFALKLARQPFEPRSMRELTLLLDKAVHPHVVAVHACGRWPDVVTGHFFFVMDWVPGPALHLWADLHNPSFQQFVDAARRVALILDTLHAGGVLHRDLKPEHILMRGPHGDPVLIDLGSGDYAGAPTLTTGPLPPGTRHLRSPEAVRFHQRHWRIDVRYAFAPTDDLYSLGVCLYRALTGHYPFSPEWPPEVLCAAIVSQQPPAPSVVNPRVPPALGAVILRLLEKDPEQRIQTGAQLHQALEVALNEQPGEARDALLFEWHEPPLPAGEGAPARSPRTRRPEWPAHKHRPPSVARAKLLRLWAELLGVLRPPPKPTPHASPRKAVVEGRARRIHPRGRQRALLAAMGVAMVALAGLAMASWHDTTTQVVDETTTAAGHKLASLAEAPHTATVASPPPAGPTIAAATAPVTPPQEAATVKKTHPASGLQAPEKKPETPRSRAASSLVRTAATAAACVGLACAGAPPRLAPSMPPEEECPPEAVAAMTKLKVFDGNSVSVELVPNGKANPITAVHEEQVTAYAVRSLMNIPDDAEFSGQLFVGSKRVFGRFKTLRFGGAQYPVCFEIRELEDRTRGIRRETGGDARNAIIISRVDIEVVRRFKRFE
jgi:serine/threonine protein kinase